ncbi:exported hypothetical protein [Candidatus Zixiibacteriota bacterium]|nr:exported hypothetical protein [candidate division Zixibacteria bacterium]
MFQRATLIMGLAVYLASVSLSFADVPGTMNYQGRLTNASGESVANNVYSLRFTLYDAVSAGTVLWAETLSVTVTDGLFSVQLGAVHPLTATMFAAPDRWLGIGVETDPELTPRTTFAAVAYAYHGTRADSVATINTATGGTIMGDVWITGRATIGPGHTNTGTYGAISGGWSNTVSGQYSVTVSGGEKNMATASWSTIAGGANNVARGEYSVISGGGGFTAADSNSARGNYSVVGGGNSNSANGIASVVSGGELNRAESTWCTIGGGWNNIALGLLGTVAGGSNGWANGYCATVSGGDQNHARADGAAIGGGLGNSISLGADAATIGGGSGNYIRENAKSSTIPGGDGCQIYAPYSFAAGRNVEVRSNHAGSFIWADSTNSSFQSASSNEFAVRASGGTRIYSNAALTAGVTLAPGASAWVSVSDSTVKRNIRPADGAEILAKLKNLPVSRWSYKSQDPSIEHIGPMAQDFYLLFKLGESDTTISTIDPSGIALAAIKELANRNANLQSEMDQLKQQVQLLIKQINEMAAKESNTKNILSSK